LASALQIFIAKAHNAKEQHNATLHDSTRGNRRNDVFSGNRYLGRRTGVWQGLRIHVSAHGHATCGSEICFPELSGRNKSAEVKQQKLSESKRSSK
jgi:hypothetical protein